MATTDVSGAELHEGQVLIVHMPDGTSDKHTIDHFTEYPGLRFVGAGDHARVVHDADGWRCTAADRERFHVQTEEPQ